MKCVKCQKREGVINIPSLEKKACEQCFTEIIERRFNKNMRLNYPELRNIKIRIKRGSDEIMHYLLKQREKKARNLTITKSSTPNIPQYTLDDIAISVIKSLTKGHDYLIRESGPLSDTSEKELNEYARIKKIKHHENKRTKNDQEIHDLIMKLNERRPGVMFSIKKFKDKLNITKNKKKS